MPTGKLIVITGPSGVGKGTLVQLLLASHPEIQLSISVTTRTPRLGEVDGKDYYFVTRSSFEQMVENNQLLEWAEYAGNCYGTPRNQVEERINQGKVVLLEIELLGARAIKATFPNALRLFILPPSVAELERRLRGRANDSDEAIKRRLQRAQEEITASDEFDLAIVNDDLQVALEEIERVLNS